MKPAGKIQPQAWLTAADTQALLAVLNGKSGGKGEGRGEDHAGMARLVGGCVRNALMNRPVMDIDIATAHTPQAVMKILKREKIRCVPTGIDHGTVTAIIDGRPFEITTLRRDVENFGRKARVAFTDDWVADAARRDFTMNALYADADGTLYDPFGGIADIRKGRVRFVGKAEDRIREDVLRILRYFRFVAHYGHGKVTRADLLACKKQARLLKNLSGERLRDEVLKLLSAQKAPDVWAVMLKHGILAPVGLGAADKVSALKKLVLAEEKTGAGADPLRRLAVLLSGKARPAQAAGDKLRLSNAQKARLAQMVLPVPARPFSGKAEDERDLRRLAYRLGLAATQDYLLLQAAGRRDGKRYLRLYETSEAMQIPVFSLRGDDVIALGIKPGPQLGRILLEMESWWIAQDFQPRRGRCLEELHRRFGPGSHP